jgi:hypothetical protein
LATCGSENSLLRFEGGTKDDGFERSDFHAECNWEVKTNFGDKFHILKQEKMSISTCVWKHLICELSLKEYCIDTSSSSALM